MARPNRYSPEVRERAVRMVFEHQREYDSQWGAMPSTLSPLRCTVALARLSDGRHPPKSLTLTYAYPESSVATIT